MNSYELSRNWFDWCFENPEKINPNHTAIYFFAIEHCNRLGWKQKFGFPSQMTMEALGIKKHQTYIKYFNDLIDFGFIKLVEKSKNQYSSNIISLISAVPKNGKALDKANINHTAKQTESIWQSNSSIDKQINNITNKPINNNNEKFYQELIFSESWIETTSMQSKNKFRPNQVKEKLEEFNTFINLGFDIKVNKKEYASHFLRWLNTKENPKQIKTNEFKPTNLGI